jgi:hypothetical protein
MKKNYSFYSILVAIPVGLLILVSFTGGQGGNFSGSPGDGGSNCTACHAAGSTYGGTPVLTNVPTAYAAGQAYNLNLAINGSSVSKFGFNITAEDASGTKIGTWSPGTGTQLRNGGSGLTHTAAGTTSNTWNFTWTAPASDQGPVTFYYSTLQANGNNANSGDHLITGQSASVLTNENVASSFFNFYPTQVVNELNIELANFDEADVLIFNMNGQQVIQTKIGRQGQIAVSSLSKGFYLCMVVSNNAVETKKFVKK